MKKIIFAVFIFSLLCSCAVRYNSDFIRPDNEMKGRLARAVESVYLCPENMPDSILLSRTHYYFDDKGRETTVFTRSGEGLPLQKTEYSYDKKGRLSMKRDWEKGEETITTVYRWKRKRVDGHLTIEGAAVDVKSVNFAVYIYKGKYPSIIVEYDSETKDIVYAQKFQWENGKIIAFNGYNADNELELVYTDSYEDGKMVSRHLIHGGRESFTSYLYDETGNLSRVVNQSEMEPGYSISFLRDRKGNWTESRTEFTDGETVVTIREFEYAE